MGQVLDCCESKQPEPAVEHAHFDAKTASEGIKLSENGRKVAGAGCAIANAALHQDQCYFEVKLAAMASDAAFCIGVCHRSPDVVKGKTELGDLERSWAFNSSRSTEAFKEGDVIGCLFDQSTGRPVLKLLKNGAELPPGSEVKGFKGTVYPGVSVTHGCELECNFSIEGEDFAFRPPGGVSGLIPSRSLV